MLEGLGLPWIPGYKPKHNYQNSILDAIDRHLIKDPGILNLSPNPSAVLRPFKADVFVTPPTFNMESAAFPERLQRLVQKFDSVERGHRNRNLGQAGEEFVVGLERRLLTEAGLPDLARKVRWVAAGEGDGAGWTGSTLVCVYFESLVYRNGKRRTEEFFSDHQILHARIERQKFGKFCLRKARPSRSLRPGLGGSS